MKNELYILKNGKLTSNSNTLFFIDNEENRHIRPINSISTIFCFGSVSLSGFFINIALKRNILVHFFSKYGTYKGSLMNQPIYNGKLIKNQILVSEDNKLRVKYGIQIIKGMKSAFITFLKRHSSQAWKKIANIKILSNSIDQITGCEATMWKEVYNFLKSEFPDFTERNFHPPKDKINCVISFINSLIYSYFLSITREVEVLPELGFLHSPKYKRFSLVLDFADLFKPYFMLNIVYDIFKNKRLDNACFNEASESVYLNDLGTSIVIDYFREYLEKQFYHNQLKRKVSIRTLMKFELEKFKSSLLNESFNYVSFKDWEKCM